MKLIANLIIKATKVTIPAPKPKYPINSAILSSFTSKGVSSYGAIAQMVGCRSAQAVGQAIGANPIAILIPCHRVIAANGNLGGYAYGEEIKRRLLELEQQCKHNIARRWGTRGMSWQIAFNEDLAEVNCRSCRNIVPLRWKSIMMEIWASNSKRACESKCEGRSPQGY